MSCPIFEGLFIRPIIWAVRNFLTLFCLLFPIVTGYEGEVYCGTALQDPSFQTCANFYRGGLEHIWLRSDKNPVTVWANNGSLIEDLQLTKKRIQVSVV